MEIECIGLVSKWMICLWTLQLEACRCDTATGSEFLFIRAACGMVDQPLCCSLLNEFKKMI